TAASSLLGTLAFCQTLLWVALPSELCFTTLRFLKQAFGFDSSTATLKSTRTTASTPSNSNQLLRLRLL
ncbi:hypothetical protein ACJRO7_026550, partial [Eucalyptus globulus]